MKRTYGPIIALVTLFGMASVAAADTLTSKSADTLRSMFTQAGLFGAPPFTTVALPTCNAALATPTAPIVWDTTALTLKVCNGTTWVGVGGLASGTSAVTGCQNRILYGNNSNVLECEAALGYVTATNTLTLDTLAVAVGATINSGVFLDITGRLRLVSSQIFENATQTPDGLVVGVGATSESVHVYEVADVGFDFANGRAGTAATADPAVIVHSRNQSTTQYLQLSSQNATGAGEIQTNLGDVVIGGNKTAITESSAQSIISIAIPTSTDVYGMNVSYIVYDINGANYVARTGSVKVQGGNSGGTATCTINTGQDAETEDGSQIATSNAATLTYTWTNVASTTNCILKLNPVSSEGVNTVAITWTATVTGNAADVAVTPQ